MRRMLVGNGDKFVGIITSKDIIRIDNRIQGEVGKRGLILEKFPRSSS